MENKEKEIVIRKSTFAYICIILILIVIISVLAFKLMQVKNEENSANTTIESNSIKEVNTVENNTNKNVSNEKTELSEKELEEFTNFLNKEENNGFIQSEYKKIEDVSWYRVLACAVSAIGEQSAMVNQEFTELTGMGSPDTVVYKYNMNDVLSFVENKTGEEMRDANDFSDLSYDEDIIFDGTGDTCFITPDGAYYNFIKCIEGYKKENNYVIKGKYVVTNQYTENGQEYNGFQVTLKKSNDGYVFVSNEFLNI